MFSREELGEHALKLDQADKDFMNGTRDLKKCVWGKGTARKEKWTPQKNWWYFRTPDPLQRRSWKTSWRPFAEEPEMKEPKILVEAAGTGHDHRHQPSAGPQRPGQRGRPRACRGASRRSKPTPTRASRCSTGAGGSLLRRRRPQGAGLGHRLFSLGRQRGGAVARTARQAGDRRHRGSCLRRRPRRGAVLRHPHRRRDGGLRRVLAPLGRADERRHHGAPAAHRRPRPRPRHAADRPCRRRRRGDRYRPCHAQGGARHDARRSREACRSRSQASRPSP